MYEWRYREGFASWGLDPQKRYRGTTAQALLRAGRADAVLSGARSAQVAFRAMRLQWFRNFLAGKSESLFGIPYAISRRVQI